MFDFEELWCQNCGKSYLGQCVKHGSFHQVLDIPIPSKAVLTLPKELTLKHVKCREKKVLGIFAKRAIANRTRFGPVHCPTKIEEKEVTAENETICKETGLNRPETSKFNPTIMSMTGAGDAVHAGIELVLAGLESSGSIPYLSAESERHFQSLHSVAVDNAITETISSLDQTSSLGILSSDHTLLHQPNADQNQVKVKINDTNMNLSANRKPDLVIHSEEHNGRAIDIQAAIMKKESNSANETPDGGTFELKMFIEDGKESKLDFTDENQCNWMIFVRPATSYDEQNLIAYQHQGKIYFASIKAIPINTELRVWYAGNYAKLLKKKLLPKVIAATIEVEGTKGWNCSVCRENFTEFEALENHTCSTRHCFGPRHRGRPRKGRPIKYIKPSKTWRARLEKMELKDMLGNQKRKRGRPPKMSILAPEEKPNMPSVETPPLFLQSPSSPLSPSSMPGDDGGKDYESNNISIEISDNDKNTLNDKSVVFKMETDEISNTGMTTRFKKERRLPRRRVQRIPKLKVRKRYREPLPCPHCDQVFMTEALYVIHVANHTGVKPYICQLPGCEKGFMSKFKLERHQLIHTSPRSHKCLYCDKSFNRKDHLKNHMTTHDPNKRRWICEQCGKEYAYHFSYRTHIAYHNAEDGKTLTCSICQKEHPNKESLLFHLKIHSGARSVKNCTEKMHQCFECGKRFFTKKDVRRHSITHTKKKDFLCQFCPQRFGRKDHLTRHLRTSHMGDTKDGKAPRQTRGSKKEHEKYVTLEDTTNTIEIPGATALQLPIVVTADSGIPVAGVSSVLSPIHHNIGNNTYLMTAPQPNSRDMLAREVPLQNFHALYDGTNAQPSLSMSNVSVTNQIPAVHGITANQIQQTHRYIQDPAAVAVRIPSVAQTIETVAINNDYHQNMQVVPSGCTPVYVTQAQHQHAQQVQHMQHDSVICKEMANIQVQHTRPLEQRQNMTVTVTDFQAGKDQGCVNDGRQNPNTFSTLLGYMETIRFLENLPTNAQGNMISQLESVAGQANIVPVATTAYTANTNTPVRQNPTELQKRLMTSHLNAYQPGT